MVEIKRKGDLLSKEEKRKIIPEIITFFKNERDEEIGIVAAEEILDFFLNNTGLELYNKGVENSVDFLKKRIEDLELDMEILLKK
jgi:uncharacterized protein (DUF2164 family)